MEVFYLKSIATLQNLKKLQGLDHQSNRTLTKSNAGQKNSLCIVKLPSFKFVLLYHKGIAEL